MGGTRLKFASRCSWNLPPRWMPTWENRSIWSFSAQLHRETLAIVQQRRRQQALVRVQARV